MSRPKLFSHKPTLSFFALTLLYSTDQHSILCLMPIENILPHRILSLAHMCHSDTVSNMLDSNVVPTPGERSAGMVEEEEKKMVAAGRL